MSEAPQAFAPGDVLAQKYRLSRLLGQGGMGAVWLAENVDIGRPVAIKLLLHRFAKDAEMLARFRMEARAAAAIGHPGIVDVLDMGQLPDGSAFIVMEQLRGETLGARLSRLGPLSVDAALWVFDRIADALQAAHAAGVVHRDLKPDNLFLVAKPVVAVKVLDFGISKFKAAEDLSLTRTGMAMGTPLYMSPEQARGAKDVGPATDLYSLGAIFYHSLAGIPPFQGDSYNELLARVLTEAPKPIGEQRPELPEALKTLVDSLLSKQAATRPTPEQVRAVIAQVYSSAGLSKDTPAALISPPGLDLTSSRPSSTSGEDIDSGRTAQRKTPEAPLADTSPSQRRPSAETPVPRIAVASPAPPVASPPNASAGAPASPVPSAPTPNFAASSSPTPNAPLRTPVTPVAPAAPSVPVAPVVPVAVVVPVAPVVGVVKTPAPAPQPSPAPVLAAPPMPPPLAARGGPPKKKSRWWVWVMVAFGFWGLAQIRRIVRDLTRHDREPVADYDDTDDPDPDLPEVINGQPRPHARVKAVITATPNRAEIFRTPGGACTNPCTITGEEGKVVDVEVSARGYETQTFPVELGAQDRYPVELTKLGSKKHRMSKDEPQ